MPISQDQLVGLTKQVFMLNYLAQGLFPCQSDVVRLIRSNKREWQFNDKFEYRMLLSVTNSGGTLPGQVFQSNVSLLREGNLDYGTYRATYGTVMDGFDVDMMLNIETAEKTAAFESDFALRMHSARVNTASMFKNFAIHGQFGVVHQLRSSIEAPNVCEGLKPKPNCFDEAPRQGEIFTIKTPVNVFQSNFQAGRALIKTKARTPWGEADMGEMYLILDNQPGYLVLISVGNKASPWQNGEFLEIQGNRDGENRDNSAFVSGWTGEKIRITDEDSPYYGMVFDSFDGGDKKYSANDFAVVGAMEGLADLFPWYTDPEDVRGGDPRRLGLDRPFRGQRDRLKFSTQQAGGWVMQKPGENIIDAIMRGTFLSKSTFSHVEIGIWINPVTRTQMGYEEGDQVRVLRDQFVAGPLIWQRGTREMDFQIGNQTVREVVEDLNFPTDVILIGPKGDLSYNCLDNAAMQIDNYIQEAWAGKPPPRMEDVAIPDEIIAKLDISQRVVYGAPAVQDGKVVDFGGSWGGGGINFGGANIRHPKNTMPVMYQENGALFTEHPFAYTVVKLREPICELTTV